MRLSSDSFRLALLTTLLTAGAGAHAAAPQLAPEMEAVLDQLVALGGKPIETLDPAEARKQPTPADAVKALLTRQRKSTDPEVVGKIKSVEIPGAAGPIKARIYWPAAEFVKPLPVVHYIHGGGWVLGDLDSYDASPRAIANAAQAIVVATDYRHAPEHPFPAAHEDSLAAYRWITKNTMSFGGDPSRIAVAGESAGGNMAAAIALNARRRGLPDPVHQVLIYPVTTTGMNTESYRLHAKARPLSTAMMQWFFKHSLKTPDDANDPMIDLLQAPLPQQTASATILTAGIDPLQSEGQQYAERLDAQGVPVQFRNYEGMSHEFFGMGAVVPQARDAVLLVGSNLRTAFGIKQIAQRLDADSCVAATGSVH